MSPESAICERLLSLSAVTALVGTRVRQSILRQSEILPAVRVQQIGETTSYHGRGGSGQYQSRIQVDVYAHASSGVDPYAQAMTVAEAIQGDDAGSGLSAWQGTAGGSPPLLQIDAVFRRDRRDPGFESEELRQVRCQQDYMVHWRRLT